MKSLTLPEPTVVPPRGGRFSLSPADEEHGWSPIFDRADQPDMVTLVGIESRTVCNTLIGLRYSL